MVPETGGNWVLREFYDKIYCCSHCISGLSDFIFTGIADPMDYRKVQSENKGYCQSSYGTGNIKIDSLVLRREGDGDR